MIYILKQYLDRQDPGSLALGGLACVLLLGLIDFFVGYEISFSIFYLAPITVVTWFAGRGYGFAIAVVSAVVWLIADLASGHTFSHLLIPYWNCLVRFGFFTIVIIILSELKRSLTRQIDTARSLQESMDSMKILRGLIPICAWCKKVRNDEGYWQQVEFYVAEHSEASFSHGICQECRDKELKRIRGSTFPP